MPRVNSNFCGLSLLCFYLMGVGAETMHSLSHGLLSDPRSASRRGRASHKGKKSVRSRFCLRNLLTANLYSSNRSRPRKCGNMWDKKKRMCLREYKIGW